VKSGHNIKQNIMGALLRACLLGGADLSAAAPVCSTASAVQLHVNETGGRAFSAISTSIQHAVNNAAAGNSTHV
jgi:hypothetical protein